MRGGGFSPFWFDLAVSDVRRKRVPHVTKSDAQSSCSQSRLRAMRRSRHTEWPTRLGKISIVLVGLTKGVVEMVRELVQAGLDELLHCGSLVDDTLHDVVDRLHFNGSPALPHLFLKQSICRPTRKRCSEHCV